MSLIRKKHPPAQVGTIVANSRGNYLGIIIAVDPNSLDNPWERNLTVRWEDGERNKASQMYLWDPPSAIVAEQDKVNRLIMRHAQAEKLHRLP